MGDLRGVEGSGRPDAGEKHVRGVDEAVRRLDAYVRAYEHLDQFKGRAQFSTWLTRIAVHEALARARRAGRFIDVPENEIEETMSPSPSNSPEKRFADRELASAIETAIEALPAPYRAVFMLRDVEEMNTAETAECLDIAKHTVKTRLHRARALMRQRLTREVGLAVRKSFTFGLARCDHVVASVLARIEASTPPRAAAGGEQRGSSAAARRPGRE